MKTKILVLALFVVLAFASTACDASDAPPAPESDSSQSYDFGSTIPVDDGVYTITGTVVGDIESLVRQVEPARGAVSGSGYGFYGTYFGPELGGKGFVRLNVLISDSNLAPIGSIVILKATDTKASVLLPGDEVTFKCRHQYESVAAVRERETFDADKTETWEIDYCRLVTPVIRTGHEPSQE